MIKFEDIKPGRYYKHDSAEVYYKILETDLDKGTVTHRGANDQGRIVLTVEPGFKIGREYEITEIPKLLGMVFVDIGKEDMRSGK